MGMIGFNPKTGGRTRLALTDEDKAGRDLFCRWLEEDGLEIRIDAIGNIFGIREGTDAAALPVMMGSHIDTVRDAGMFDGVYGVLGGLEVIRTLNDNGIKTQRPLVVAAFTNEEGARFQLDMMGSIFYTRALPLENLYSVADDSGLTAGDEVRRIGYCGNETIPAGNYFELHIEQGPRLDAQGIQIGAVEGIQGLAWWRGEYCGESNHAGSTPMDMRKDALLGAADLAMEAEALAVRIGSGSVATMGRIKTEPDVINIVPGKCSFTMDFRQYDPLLLKQGKKDMEGLIAACAKKRGLGYRYEKLVEVDPVIFNSEMVTLVERKARELGLSVKRMYSGAAHDAQFLCPVCPSAMIFVPSLKGRSHCPEEWTEFRDAENGCNVLLHSVLELL
jgi:N-carbamoyl-L-amino-acid hydrolase